MQYIYTRSFCRDCRLHFEYAVIDGDSEEERIVLCPQCSGPAKHGPFQSCDQAQYERIEAKYERLVDFAETKCVSKRSRGKPRRMRGEAFDDDDFYFYFDDYVPPPPRRKRSRKK